MSLKMIQSTVARPAFSATVFSPACTAAPPINIRVVAMLSEQIVGGADELAREDRRNECGGAKE
jgi:hypothetical protein